jgi:hypothetical protein
VNILEPRIYLKENRHSYFSFFNETRCPVVYQQKIYIAEEYLTMVQLECLPKMLAL